MRSPAVRVLFSSDDGDDADGDDGPLTDYEYTEPPQVVDFAEQGVRKIENFS
ncbi:hypothetical protein [Natronorubrum tibetense]|uniref:hypothetical protein n=1 Tax=Natronorubrum tibetense TaxID=63128 RepID=UPI00036B88D7|nr:hypothetical protein [Natronorubrum tibetense]